MSTRKKKNSEFDAIIRDKMSGLGADYQPASWDLLSEKLNQANGVHTGFSSEGSVDKLIQGKLKNINPNYRSDHWQQLAERLTLQQDRIHAIFRAKTGELVASLLLIWTVLQWAPPTTTPLPQVVVANTSESIPPVIAPHTTLATPSATAASNKPPLLAKALRKDRSIAATGKQGILSTSSGSAENDAILANTSANAFSIAEALPSSIQDLTDVATLPLADREFIADVQSISEPISIKEALYKPLPIVSFEYQTSQPVASINNEGMAFRYRNDELPNLYNIKPFQKRKALRVGMMGAPDYNKIITPPQIVNGEKTTEVSVERYALGYSGGITLGFDANRWEIETGLVYSAQRYTPLQVLFVEGSVKTGFYAEQLKHFEFNSVYFPLNLRYNFLLRDKWRIYGMAGGAWHLTLQANYYVDFQPNARLMAAPVAPESPYEPPSGIDNQNLVKGWLEGGSLQGNSYFSINGSIGIERYMTTRWSIFAQPTYQHWFFHPKEGIGPFQDRIHSLSILTGVKIRI